MPQPYEIATWRFEMIAPLQDESLSSADRRRVLRERTASPVCWPSGEERRVPRATLYRWLLAYRRFGLDGLLPKRRKDRGRPRHDRTQWVDRAVQLLLERPGRSLNLVIALLKAEYPDAVLRRSTLQRDLQVHPSYADIRRLRKGERRLRTRFEARVPHQIWQLDAKGPFTVKFASGDAVRLVVLSILDDHSRMCLGIGLATSESLSAAVRVFRQAAALWGLPERTYCDRHSVYDSLVFRTGLAVLGVRRIPTKPRNPPARGKIERYHRFLGEWFVGELEHQLLVSLQHVEDLAQAFKDALYNSHRHRGLKCSPAECLAGRRSPREASMDDLQRAFWIEKTLKTHVRTGEVEISGQVFRAPRTWAGRRARLRIDPVDRTRAWLITDQGEEILLEPALPAEPAAAAPAEPPAAPGRLQRLLDRWRGRDLPQAIPGFGLPEIFLALGSYLGRRVPQSPGEAATIQAFYRVNGPFTEGAFRLALDHAVGALGRGRPLQVVLAHLVKLTRQQPRDAEEGLS